MLKKIIGVIPARWSSSRLPGKPLADILGKPMIQHVYERACAARSLSSVIIAADDERVIRAAEAFGARAVMTSPDHPNGTSRVEEAARGSGADAVINIQGDEPMLNHVMIDEIAEALNDSSVVCATLCRKMDEADFENPNAVKVVRDKDGDALYFSRSMIPYRRNDVGVPVYHHIGIYGYTAEFLKLYASLPMTPLAETESLEQLKVLENGYKIRVKATSCDDRSRGVDTPEDLEAVRALMRG